MTEGINHGAGRLRKTVFTDIDGDTFYVEKADSPGLGDGEYVYINADHSGSAYAPARDLIRAIERAAGIEPLIVPSLEKKIRDAANAALSAAGRTGEKPVQLWTEVQYRPARAVKVTPELVRTLAAGELDIPDELGELTPKFSAHTGEPKGVELFDPVRCDEVLAGVGQVVVLRHGQSPQRLEAEDFEQMYEEVPA